MIRRLAIVAIAGAVALTISQSALAGYAVQPADGTTVQTARPTFLVYIDGGETLPQVQVASQPDHNDYGFTAGFAGTCLPYTPFSEPHKYTCELPWDLQPGTYYWAYTFSVNECSTDSYGYTWCLPVAHFSGPFRFTVTSVPAAPPQAVPPAAVPPTTYAPDGASLPTERGPIAAGESHRDPDYTAFAKKLTKGATSSVYCWGSADWSALTADQTSPETSLLGFVDPLTNPSAVNLSATICSELDEVHYGPRPQPTLGLATAVDTLAHEAIHTLGYVNEALTECYAMQVTPYMSQLLGASYAYGRALARLLWRSYYIVKPPAYISPRCRNGGPWDLNPTSNVWP